MAHPSAINFPEKPSPSRWWSITCCCSPYHLWSTPYYGCTITWQSLGPWSRGHPWPSERFKDLNRTITGYKQNMAQVYVCVHIYEKQVFARIVCMCEKWFCISRYVCTVGGFTGGCPYSPYHSLLSQAQSKLRQRNSGDDQSVSSRDDEQSLSSCSEDEEDERVWGSM